MKTKKLISSAALAATLIAGATVVKANPELELISGSITSVLVALTPTGSITFVGSVGQWELNVSTGQNNLGSGPTSPIIDLNSVDTAAGYAGTLAPIEVLYTSQESANARGEVIGEFGGTTTTTLTDWQWLGYSPFAKTLLLTKVGPMGPGAVSGTAYGNTGTPTGPYWLTEDVLITGGTRGTTEQSSFDANSSIVPDGGTTVVMLGSLFAGMGAIRSKFGSKRA
jgi:hypothetical protein